MGEQASHNIAEIEGLLSVRQQITGWLERLDAAGSRAPESVRTKVRSDYRARLSQVVAQLSTHGDLISSTLDGLRAQARELVQSRGEELEVRAEAELRHTVGEYTDDEWQLVELESSGKIEGFDQEISRLAAEIGRLEEVQGLIQPAPARAGSAVTPDPVPERESITVTHDIEIPPMLDPEPLSVPDQPALTLVRDSEPIIPSIRPEAPRFTPRPGSAPKPRDSQPSRAIPFPPGTQQQATQTTTTAPGDELAFLRSMTLDHPPANARPAQQAAPTDDRAPQAGARTLKCAECGSLNRPTEWYCERCGAELAAL
jgi:hypothetical protein